MLPESILLPPSGKNDPLYCVRMLSSALFSSERRKCRGNETLIILHKAYIWLFFLRHVWWTVERDDLCPNLQKTFRLFWMFWKEKELKLCVLLGKLSLRKKCSSLNLFQANHKLKIADAAAGGRVGRPIKIAFEHITIYFASRQKMLLHRKIKCVAFCLQT